MNEKKSKLKKKLILGVLFFLPVLFLLFLYPSTHNYNPLDIVKNKVQSVSNFTTEQGAKPSLKNHITVLAFFGKNPMDNAVSALNLKELIYDNFTGFKGFQVLALMPNGTETQVKRLKKELEKPDALKYWQFAYATNAEIVKVFRSLKYHKGLSEDLHTNTVFIIDKDLNQRGRLDDRTDKQIANKAPLYELTAYNCIEVSEIKNKMSEDLRILFTEYRQKRKGNFNSSSRRTGNITTNE